MPGHKESTILDSLTKVRKGEALRHKDLRSLLNGDLKRMWGIEASDTWAQAWPKAVWHMRWLINQLPDADWRMIALIAFNASPDADVQAEKTQEGRFKVGAKKGLCPRFHTSRPKLNDIAAELEGLIRAYRVDPPRPPQAELDEIEQEYSKATQHSSTNDLYLRLRDDQYYAPDADGGRGAAEPRNQITPVSPLTPRNRHKRLAIILGSIAGAMVLIGTASLVALDASGSFARGSGSSSTGGLTPSSAKDSTPFSIQTYTDPSDVNPANATKQLNDVGSFLFPQGALTTLPRPTVNACNQLYSWAHQHGGVDIEATKAAIQLTALTSSTVQVVGFRLHIQAESNPNPNGDEAACPQGDETTVSYLSVDLDQQTATFRYGSQDSAPAPFAINVIPNKPERIYLWATSREHYCKWSLDLHIQVGSRKYWQPINDNGKPFVTAPSSESYGYYLWRGTDWFKEQ